MYISEISGHHSATIAIEKALRIQAPSTEILNINAFRYTNPISEKIINRLYMAVIKRTPQLWDYLYDNPEIVKKLDKIKQTIHKVNSQKFKNLFDSFKPDVVCCTQAFPCGMVADYKKIYQSSLPLVAVLTDFIPHAYWIYDTVSSYIVPSQEVGERLIQRGVQADKIKPLGIPCDPKFTSPVDRHRVFTKLDFTEADPVVLVMGGGQGLGPIKTIVRSLAKTRQRIQLVVIAGNNKKLYRALKRKEKKFPCPLRVFGYVNTIHEYMDISTLIVTKPGGITTAESLAKNLPIVIIKPIPGQEANNTLYLVHHGAAIKVDKLSLIHEAIDDILSVTDKVARMRNAAQLISKPNASSDIAQLLLQFG